MGAASAGQARTEGLAVFIGGTGRSGTTILAQILGRHPALYTFPVELRFLTDPDGLLGLKQALVDEWAPFQADVALTRFASLMAALERRYWGRYPSTGLGRVFGRRAYRAKVAAFLDRITAFAYPGAWAGRTTIIEKALVKAAGKHRHRLGPLVRRIRYQGPLDSKSFLEAASGFVRDLLSGPVTAAGKLGFVEHTPTNALHAGFLLKLFPLGRLVFMERDPRDVISSFRTQDWGPTRTEWAWRMVRDMYQRSRDVRASLPADAILTVRLESLVADPRGAVSKILDFLGLEFAPSVVNVDLSRHNVGRWRSDPDAALVADLVSRTEVFSAWHVADLTVARP